MKYITLLFLLLINSISFGQKMFVLNGKAYSSTDEFLLYIPEAHEDIKCSIAKAKTGGFFIISIKGSMAVRGKVIIYLDDVTVINLIDKKVYDRVDNTNTTIYTLTQAELNILSSVNINSIRVSIICAQCVSSTNEGDFHASNEPRQGFGSDGITKEMRINVPALLQSIH